MAFTIKLAEYSDMEQAVKVEVGTMGDYTYLQSAWHYYHTTPGKLVCALDGDYMLGIGRLSVLPDGSGWLECLRVLPQYQGQGAGKQIYSECLRLAEQYHCPSIAMYTSTQNRRSSGLAERFGLTLKGSHRGYVLNDLKGETFAKEPSAFVPANWQMACRLLLPLKEQYADYFSLNRTFYHVNRPNIQHFAARGFVFWEEKSGSVVVCGARFCHEAGLHIAAMGGDYNRCIDFAINLARALGVPKITCTICSSNSQVQRALRQRGFAAEKAELITKELVF